MHNKHGLLLLGGDIDAEAFLSLRAEASVIVCADSGGEFAKSLDVDIDFLVGDLDSITPDALEHFKRSGAEIERDSDQYSNDFEKALKCLLRERVESLTILGFGGKRLDHTLANVSVLLRYAQNFKEIVLRDSFGYHRLLIPANSPFELQILPGTNISLSPIGRVTGVVTEGLYYPLRSEELEPGQREGLSNVASAEVIKVAIVTGALLISINDRL